MATERSKELTNQLVVRVSRDLHEALRVDAVENGRTVAQSVRFHLSRALLSSGRQLGMRG